MRILAGLTGLMLIIITLGGCSSGLDYKAATDAPLNRYTLAPGDTIEVAAVNEDNITGEYVVDDKGFLDMPYIGRVNVNGLTAEQADQLMSEFYGNGYLTNPDIAIKIKTYRPFFILGEVENPGRYDYADGLTVLNAVATAGGFTYRAQQRDFEIIRQVGTPDGEPAKLEGRGLATPVFPGDTIYVTERLF